MLTLYSRHFDEAKNEWASIVIHVFSKSKNARADYYKGIDAIKAEFVKRKIPVRKLIKYTDNCASENKSKYVLADSKLDEDFVGIFKTPGKISTFTYIFSLCMLSLLNSGHGKSTCDGLHGEPIRQIRIMNNENEGQTIDEIVRNLTKNEEAMRLKRTNNFIRIFVESDSVENTKSLQLKNASKLNIKMTRQFTYDKQNDKVLLKEIPCICNRCLDGDFHQCPIFDQPIVEAEINHVGPQRELRKSKIDKDHDEDIEDEEQFEYQQLEVNQRRIKCKMDSEFIQGLSVEKELTETASQNKFQTRSLSIDSDDFSSPIPDQMTSSQKEESNGLNQFEFFGDQETDEDYLRKRIDCMGDTNFLEPTQFETNKACMEAIFKKKGFESWVIGWSLNYFANMLIEQTSDVQDVCFLKCELSEWVNAENQYDWHYLLINEEEKLRKAKRILIPWLRGSHWTVFHYDSYRNIIEYFDSKHNLPSDEDVESISDFLKVSF